MRTRFLKYTELFSTEKEAKFIVKETNKAISFSISSNKVLLSVSLEGVVYTREIGCSSYFVSEKRDRLLLLQHDSFLFEERAIDPSTPHQMSGPVAHHTVMIVESLVDLDKLIADTSNTKVSSVAFLLKMLLEEQAAATSDKK